MLQQFHIWYLSEENENTNAKRYLYPFVHCRIIYNSYNMEITQVSTDGWMDKKIVGHTHTHTHTLGRLFSHEKRKENLLFVTI